MHFLRAAPVPLCCCSPLLTSTISGRSCPEHPQPSAPVLQPCIHLHHPLALLQYVSKTPVPQPVIQQRPLPYCAVVLQQPAHRALISLPYCPSHLLPCCAPVPCSLLTVHSYFLPDLVPDPLQVSHGRLRDRDSFL